jgi:hypothetical protein
LRAAWLRRHLEVYPECGGERFFEDPRLQDLVKVPRWIEEEPSLWTEIRRRLQDPAAEESLPAVAGGRRKGTPVFSDPPIRLWRWAMAGLGLVMIVVFNVLIHRTPPSQKSAIAEHPALSPRVTVNYAEVRGRRARSHIFQTESSSYIWFVRSDKSGGE